LNQQRIGGKSQLGPIIGGEGEKKKGESGTDGPGGGLPRTAKTWGGFPTPAEFIILESISDN